jgi:membrane protein implicated in regulation of membrane protease activity
MMQAYSNNWLVVGTLMLILSRFCKILMIIWIHMTYRIHPVMLVTSAGWATASDRTLFLAVVLTCNLTTFTMLPGVSSNASVKKTGEGRKSLFHSSFLVCQSCRSGGSRAGRRCCPLDGLTLFSISTMQSVQEQRD